MTERLVPLFGEPRRHTSWSEPAETSVPLTHGPRYVRQPRGLKWHIPRSGRQYPPLPISLTWARPWPTDQPRTVYELWCGQSVLDVAKATTRWNHPTDGEICGTCMGRAVAEGARKASDFTFIHPKGTARS